MENPEQLGIDDIDREIIRLLIANPEVTHEEIATRVSRSQPAVGARILKLKKKQLISSQVGVNFKTAGLVLGIVTFSGAHPAQLKAYLNTIPQFVHVFKTSGLTNFMILVPGTTMKEIEEAVDIYLRPHPDIADIATNYLMESLKNLVLPYYLTLEPTPVPVIDAKSTIETPLPTIQTRPAPKKVLV
jgi:DNA-binding Lrp family transcriptional regulator